MIEKLRVGGEKGPPPFVDKLYVGGKKGPPPIVGMLGVGGEKGLPPECLQKSEMERRPSLKRVDPQAKADVQNMRIHSRIVDDNQQSTSKTLNVCLVCEKERNQLGHLTRRRHRHSLAYLHEAGKCG